MAMPWSKAKAIEAEYKSGVRDRAKLTALFDACFRIQREAIESAGHFIPMVVENVRGAQKWVGRSRWNYGSFHLWGDVPALMPMGDHKKLVGKGWFNDSDDPHRMVMTSSKSPERKRISAMIAKIPFVLSSWIARCYYISDARDPSQSRRSVQLLDRAQ